MRFIAQKPLRLNNKFYNFFDLLICIYVLKLRNKEND